MVRSPTFYFKKCSLDITGAETKQEIQTLLKDAHAFLSGYIRAGNPVDTSLRPILEELLDEISDTSVEKQMEEIRQRSLRVIASIMNAVPE